MSSTPNNLLSRQSLDGKQAIGDYIMGETIGKGSFGKVKKGRHIHTGETVAVKIINREKLQTAKMDAKIVREIKILKLFSHPNICRLYDVIYTPTEIFLIMEHVENGELFNYIVSKGRLPEVEARYIFQQIICAVEYCHRFLVVHRDLKPENILLGPGLQVKLIDFGLSNIMKDGGFLQTSCGSPNYAAPEVIKGCLYWGPEVDLWSCGVILYSLLCGCLPFDEESMPVLFSKIKKGTYRIPDYVPSGPRELIEKLLVVEPVQRLTIAQIRDHPWFTANLPPRLSFNESLFTVGDKRISSNIVNRVVRALQKRERDVREEIEKGEGKGAIVYNILLDADQRLQYSTEAEAIIKGRLCSSTETAMHSGELAHVPRATEKELHLGLLLTQSPAMESLLDGDNATSSKHAYNGGNFIPASVQETRHGVGMSPTMSPSTNGTFRIRMHTEVPAESNGTGASSYRDSVSGTYLQNAVTAGSRKGSGRGPEGCVNERQRVGSVAKSHMIYTMEEQEFIVRNNVGWRIGLMTDFNTTTALRVLYRTLKNYAMEWKIFHPFRLLVRSTPDTFVRMGNSTGGSGSVHMPYSPSATLPQVLLFIYVFRIRERHDGGLLVDFSVVKGSMLALDVVFRLSSDLIQYMS